MWNLLPRDLCEPSKFIYTGIFPSTMLPTAWCSHINTVCTTPCPCFTSAAVTNDLVKSCMLEERSGLTCSSKLQSIVPREPRKESNQPVKSHLQWRLKRKTDFLCCLFALSFLLLPCRSPCLENTAYYGNYQTVTMAKTSGLPRKSPRGDLTMLESRVPPRRTQNHKERMKPNFPQQ